jgi:phosphate-selective porin OprO and OprP
LKLKTSSLLVAGALFGSAVMPAQADNAAMMELLKVLRDKGTISAHDYETLTNAAKADKEAMDADKEAMQADTAEVKEAAAKLPKITTDGKLKFESPDGHWSFQPIGRVMWDAVDADGDGYPDFHGTELRRARLGFEGEIYDWGYKFEADLADGNASIKDAYVSYGTMFDENKFGLKMGQSQIAFGFNTAASSKYMTFMDRPWYADSALSPARESGLVAKLSDHRWSVASSVTVGEFDDGETDEAVDGTTSALRGTYVPYMQDKNHIVQVGAGYMGVSSGKDGFSYSQHLVAHKDNTKIVSTETISQADFDGIDAFEGDVVGIFGSFHTLAEYNNFTAKSDISNSDIDIDSYSVEAGYFLTGESMKLKHGLWSGIKPISPYGAWQVAARYEKMDIDGHAVAGDDKADKWTVGLNYYPTQNTRLMLNYDKVLNWEEDGVDTDSEPSSVKFRAQAYW